MGNAWGVYNTQECLLFGTLSERTLVCRLYLHQAWANWKWIQRQIPADSARSQRVHPAHNWKGNYGNIVLRGMFFLAYFFDSGFSDISWGCFKGSRLSTDRSKHWIFKNYVAIKISAVRQEQLRHIKGRNLYCCFDCDIWKSWRTCHNLDISVDVK